MWLLAVFVCLQNSGVSDTEALPLLGRIDAAISKWVRETPARSHRIDGWMLQGETPESAPISASVDLQPFGSRWIASVNITGHANGCNAFLRLYGTVAGKFTLISSTIDTALMRAARREKGLEGRSHLGWCLQHRIAGVSILEAGRRVRVSYEHLWGG